MDRELVLAVLVLFACGSLLVTAGLAPTRRGDAPSGTQLERASWGGLWRPLIPTALALALLAGWAFQEPNASDEAVRAPMLVVAVVVAALWFRAGVRAFVALRPGRAAATVATAGLLRPHVLVSPTFAEVVDPAALAAALAHEAAHVRHRDPLRLWVARFVTDLQGALPGARARLDAWEHALEMARDEEARIGGVDGADLAAAILAAARLGDRSLPSTVGLMGPGDALRERVDRLLAPLVVPPQTPGLRAARAARLALFALAVAGFGWVGVKFGEPIVRAFPWVAT
ncbi:MAG: hypothetical protein EPO40_02480 [Myxococcaceae bacterium]|nr:MAG: hypothetical protein EPO40_02480 [Myxococcaceae bacterium]